MGFIVGAYVSPAALAAIALGVVLALRIPWWAALLVAAACAALAVTAALFLMRFTERRAMAVTAHWAVQQQLRADVLEPVAPPRRVTASGGVTINVINPTDVQMAAVVRSITGGTDGQEERLARQEQALQEVQRVRRFGAAEPEG